MERGHEHDNHVVDELKQSFDDLSELVVEDPLNVEIQKMRYEVYVSMLKARGVGDVGRFHDAREEMQVKRQKCGGEEEGGGTRTPMHPKNVYRYETPDFGGLVELFPELKKYTVNTKDGNVSLDFGNWDACRELVSVQFRQDFGITWTLTKPHLIPPLANRLNYLCFIHDLLSLWCREPKNRASYEYTILDIGCGANLVYPLLGAAYFGWSFVGCDINNDALRIAAKNRDSNSSVAPCIILKNVAKRQGHDGSLGIIGSCLDDGDVFDACVCNPPFFSDETEMGQNPSTDYGGTRTEMVHPGGEEAFVLEMIQDSEKYKDSVAWFSSMVGKKKTLKSVKKYLYSLGNVGIRTNQLVQGTTHRWVISWSFIAPRHIQDMPLPRYSKC